MIQVHVHVHCTMYMYMYMHMYMHVKSLLQVCFTKGMIIILECTCTCTDGWSVTKQEVNKSRIVIKSFAGIFV